MPRFGLVLLFCLAASPAAARDIYVNNVRGDDLFDGLADQAITQRRGPARTLAKALRVARPGDRIVLANTGEPYRESVTLYGDKNSGQPFRPFVIQGNGATLDGSVETPPEAWENAGGNLFRFRPRMLHYQQLFHDGRPLKRVQVVEGWQLPELQPLEWAIWQGYVYFRTEKGRLPDEYGIRHAGAQTGITLYKVSDVAVLDLVIQGFAVDGIGVHDGFGPCYLAGLLCRGNGRSGIAVAGATRVQIEACTAGDNGDSQLHVSGMTETYVNRCDLIAGTGPAIRQVSGRVYVDGKRTDAAASDAAPATPAPASEVDR